MLFKFKKSVKKAPVVILLTTSALFYTKKVRKNFKKYEKITTFFVRRCPPLSAAVNIKTRMNAGKSAIHAGFSHGAREGI
jgi:hypothetical protein